MTEPRSRGNSADRALRWIGDLDHPFYSDERNRFVWYEASAIAFQLLFIGSYFMAGILMWIGGGDALPWVLAMFVPTMCAAIVFQSFLKSRSAEYWPTKNDLFRRRGQLGVLAAVFFLTGLVRAVTDLERDFDGAAASFAGGTSTGIIAGLIVGPVVAVAFVAYKSRNAVDDDS